MRTVWKTGSQSFSYPFSSMTVSFVNFSLKGGGIATNLLTSTSGVAPSLVTSSTVKSGDSRSFFFDLSSFFLSSSSFFFSSSVLFPGREEEGRGGKEKGGQVKE